ncbi:hypothetical protein FRC12_015954 [Ceratobasidium sp. 428]|nr:hypothetical protein FRC12_015954 [Ceratobasidium sp. 428]
MPSSGEVATNPTHDAKYYFDDGSVIFLVEDVLFKVHTSRLVSESQVFRDMFQLPKAAGEGSPPQPEGSSDNNPIGIPQIKASAFRHLLLFLYGFITDPIYQALVAEVVDDKQRTVTAFKSYLDISSLAHRFCMPATEKWALRQLWRVLASPTRLAELKWDPVELLDGLSHAKVLDDSEMEYEVRNLIGCHLQAPQTRSSPRRRSTLVSLWGPNTHVAINSNMISLYKNHNLKVVDPALFGHVFCSVLSEGYKSSTWADLAVEDRSKLLAAQVYLTPLPLASLHLNWAKKPVEIFITIKPEARAACFSTCSDQFVDIIFPVVFDALYLERLQANTPLTGILALRELPKRRRDLLQQINQNLSGCGKDCGKLIIHALDHNIDLAFEELCRSYHDKIR